MRVIIAGSRDIVLSQEELNWIVYASGFMPSVILSGTAKGADRLGEQWAIDHGVELEKYPANWDTFGKKAGYMRNDVMARKADALIALWDGKSKGTRHMINLAKEHELEIHIWRSNVNEGTVSEDTKVQDRRRVPKVVRATKSHTGRLRDQHAQTNSVISRADNS